MLVLGYFDPLQTRDVLRLREVFSGNETSVVAVDDPPEALLTTRARAELVASLAAVDYVVSDVQGAVQNLPIARLHDLREMHKEHRLQLFEHVARRQRSGA